MPVPSPPTRFPRRSTVPLQSVPFARFQLPSPSTITASSPSPCTTRKMTLAVFTAGHCGLNGPFTGTRPCLGSGSLPVESSSAHLLPPVESCLKPSTPSRGASGSARRRRDPLCARTAPAPPAMPSQPPLDARRARAPPPGRGRLRRGGSGGPVLAARSTASRGEPFRLVCLSLPRKQLGVHTSPDNLSRRSLVRRDFPTDLAEVPGLVSAILRVDRLG